MSISKPIFWITGNYFESCRKWQEIVSLLNDPNITVLDCGSGYKTSPDIVGAGDIIKTLSNKDIFDDRPRIVKIKGIPDNYNLLLDAIDLVNNKNVLVIDSPIGLRSKPPSTRFNSIKNTNFFKKIKEIGKVFEFQEYANNKRDAISWVQKLAKLNNKNIGEDAAKILVEFRGLNLDGLYTDLNRLIDYDKKAEITEQHVKDLCVPLFLKTVWDMTADLDRGNVERVLSHLQGFYQSLENDPVSEFNSQIEQMFGALYYHFEMLAIMVIGCQKQLTDKSLINGFSGIKKREKVNDEYQWNNDKFSNQALKMACFNDSTKIALNRFNDVKVCSILRNLGQCWQRFRMSASRVVGKLCLDSFALFACGAINDKQSLYVRGRNVI